MAARARTRSALVARTVDELSIQDERAFRHVPLYAPLKELLRRDGYEFQVLPRASARWNHALLLNLTYWGGDGGGDVVESERVPADVIAHAALHHLAARLVRDSERQRKGEREGKGASTHAPSSAVGTPEVLFFGESIASAFDAYLVGHLLSAAPRCAFLATQVPAMAEVAREAGLSVRGFEALLETMARDPETSFESLRELLYDTSLALVAARSTRAAHAVLVRAAAHRFGSLLHRYELSTWVLYARAYAVRGADVKADVTADVTHPVRTFDQALRRAESPLLWLSSALAKAGERAGKRGV